VSHFQNNFFSHQDAGVLNFVGEQLLRLFFIALGHTEVMPKLYYLWFIFDMSRISL